MRRKVTFISILIGLLFFLNSSQYLSWFYILGQNYTSGQVDFIGQILGKLFQALGILLFCLYKRHDRLHLDSTVEFSILIAVNFIMTIFVILPNFRSFSPELGLIMNIFIGILYATYVSFIIKIVPKEHYAISFGLGIGLSCFFSYILYKFDTNYVFITSSSCLYFYGIVVFAIIMFLLKNQRLFHDHATNLDCENTAILLPQAERGSNIFLVSIILIFVSIAYAMGYFVPGGDIGDFNISVETMRLVYFASLVIAGFFTDKNRKYGAVLSIIALAFAFSMPLMRDNPTGVYITWILSYFAGGFITIYRTVFFLDVAKERDRLYLAPIGLAIGRASEPIGMILRLKLENNNALLLLVISVLFSTTLVLFAFLVTKSHLSDEMIANASAPIDLHSLFLSKYEISERESQILDEILEHQSNKEIAAKLFITEATVKFHVKNLLKKTGCKNRNELINLYNSSQ